MARTTAPGRVEGRGHRRGPRWPARALLAAAMVGALAGAVAPGPAGAAGAGVSTATARTATGKPTVRTHLATAVCSGAAGSLWTLTPAAADAATARQLLTPGARVPMKGGWFVVPADPTWGPQPTTDSSGNSHQGSLYWAMPLLREGIRSQDQAMIDRFYFVLSDFLADNPAAAPKLRSYWTPLPEAYRLLTLACALAGPRGGEPWLADAVRSHVRYLTDTAGQFNPRGNNTTMWQQTALAVAARLIGDDARAATALQRLQQVVAQIVLPDGSAREGSVAYTWDNYRWLDRWGDVLRAAGLTPPPTVARSSRMADFLVAATRPDGVPELLGDGALPRWRLRDVTGTPLEFVASGGTRGPRPTALMSSYAGGFVFGRSGWGTERPLTAETFYSVRTGAGRPTILHGHRDQGSVTLFDRGAEVVIDPGTWRYDSSRLRAYLVGRAAHNVITVDGKADPAAAAVRVRRAVSTPAYDLISLDDPAYAKDRIGLRRDVLYARAGRFLLVLDTVTAPRSISVSQRWQLPREKAVQVATGGSGTGGSDKEGAAVTAAGGSPADATVRWLGRPVLSVTRGATAPYTGWSSRAYAEAAPSPTVRARRSGSTVRLLTLIAARPAGTPDRTSLTGTLSGTAGQSTADVQVSTADGTWRVRWRHGTVRVDAG